MSARRIVVIVLLLGLMFGLRALSEAVVSGVHTSALLTIGFVVLAAYALAELTSGLGLPRVTGYILAGVAVGPHTSGLLTPEAVTDLGVFNTLALALIALEAGLELRIDGLRRVLKTLGSIVLFKIPLSWLLVGGAFVASAGLLPGDALGLYDRIGIGLIIGALAVGTSPAVSIAVISETGAKGKLPDLVLAMAVFKDVVMIVMLAAALTIAGGLADGGALDLGVFKALGFKVAASIGAGIVLGAAMIAWLKWVKWELVLILLLMSYGVNTIAEILHLKMLLVFIAAGFTVTNFSHYGHDLHKPLALVALPVFVIFFSTVGAGLDLRAALAVAPVAGILFVARLGVMAISTRLGARIAGEPPAFGKRAWLAFISQAGVALGLLLVAKTEAPHYGAALVDTATVLISLNLLIGPILLRMTLTGSDSKAPRAEAESAVTAPPLEPLDDAGLRAIYDSVSAKLDGLRERLKRDVIGDWSAHAGSHCAHLSQADDPLAALTPWQGRDAMAAVDESARALRDYLADLPTDYVGRYEPTEHLAAEHAFDRRSRLTAAVLRTVNPTRRHVPVREAGRSQVEGHLLPALRELVAVIYAAECERLDRIVGPDQDDTTRDNTTGARLCVACPDADEAAAHVAERSADLLARLDRELAIARRKLHDGLRFGGTPRLPTRQLRFMRVAREVHAAAVDLANASDDWAPVVEGAADRARIRLQITVLADALNTKLQTSLEQWRNTLHARAFDGVDRVMEALTDTSEAFNQARTDGSDTLRSLIASRRDSLDTLCCAEVLPSVDEMRRDAAERPALADVADAMPQLLERLPESATTLPASMDIVGDAENLADALSKVPLRRVARGHFESEFSWGLRDAEDAADRLVARLAQHLGEVAGVITEVFTLALETLDGEDPKASMVALRTARRGVAQAQRVVRGARREMKSEAHLIGDEVSRALAAAVDGTLHDVLGPGATSAPRTSPAPRNGRRPDEPAPIARVLRRTGQALTTPWRLVTESELVRDARRAEGVERVGPTTMREELEALTITQAQRDRLPYVVTKVFTHGTLTDMGARPVGHEGEVAAIRAAWERSQAGGRAAILLTGDEGSGKSSVAFATLRPLARQGLIRIEPADRTRSVEELCRTLGAALGAFDVRTVDDLIGAVRKREPKAILLDPIEGFFSRTTGGLAQVRSLIRLIDATCDKVCWAVCVAAPAARLLDRLCGLSEPFTDHVVFSRLGGPELGAIMDARCRLAGLRPHFPRERGIAGSVARLVPAAAGVDERKRRAFYRDLARASGGNISDASHLWLAAVESVTDGQVVLSPVDAPRLAWFDQLNRDSRRILALMVVSGSISRDEAREALGFTIERLTPAWGALEAVGLLGRDPDDPDRCLVWRPAWRTVVDRLQRVGLLPGGLR